MAGTQPRNVFQPSAQSGGEQLTCQWCSVALPAGETICPTCGSPGIPDTSMVVPGVEDDAPELLVPEPERGPEDDLVEWWNEETSETPRRGEADGEGTMPVILGLVGTGVVCVLLGLIVAPILLASVFENSLGINVEDAGDLRPLGAILGLLVAAFIGAIGVWVTAPRR